MRASADIVRTVDGWVTLRGVIEALLSVEGVGSADAVLRPSQDGLEIVGLLTVEDTSSLTPQAVLNKVRGSAPKHCWPHRVLLAFERPALAARAA